jgi:hypothetical protein
VLISTALPGKAAAWPTPRWPGRSAPTAARCCCSRPRTCSGTALAGVGGGDGEDEQLPAAARGQLADVTRLGDAEADGRWAQHDGDDSDDDGRRHDVNNSHYQCVLIQLTIAITENYSLGRKNSTRIKDSRRMPKPL